MLRMRKMLRTRMRKMLRKWVRIFFCRQTSTDMTCLRTSVTGKSYIKAHIQKKTKCSMFTNLEVIEEFR